MKKSCLGCKATSPHDLADLAYQALLAAMMSRGADIRHVQRLECLPYDKIRVTVQVLWWNFLKRWRSIHDGRLGAVDFALTINLEALGPGGQGNDVEFPYDVGEDL